MQILTEYHHFIIHPIYHSATEKFLSVTCCYPDPSRMRKDEPVVLPNLKIVNAIHITNNTATLQANILEKGTAEIVEFGFIWQAEGETLPG